jgi:hypothetical protein
MSRPFYDERRQQWEYRVTHRGFVCTQDFFRGAYQWVLGRLLRVRASHAFVTPADVAPVSPPRLPTYEDVVMMLAHAKWNCRSLEDSLIDWLRDGKVWTFDPLPAAQPSESLASNSENLSAPAKQDGGR